MLKWFKNDYKNFDNLTDKSEEVEVPAFNVLVAPGRKRAGELLGEVLYWFEQRDLDEERDYHYIRNLDFPRISKNTPMVFVFVNPKNAVEFKLRFG